MLDVCAMGEILIDFTPQGHNASGVPLFEANPGGAPVNVLAALAKLGRTGAFIGQVGADSFGDLLRKTLVNHGIETAGLLTTSRHHTTLAFVHLDEQGERSFSFCRDAGADRFIEQRHINTTCIDNATIFHFGSVSLTHEPARAATKFAVAHAKAQGKLISFDPNYRAALWHDEQEAIEQIEFGLDAATLVKLSHEELTLLTRTQSLERGSDALMQRFGIALLLVTMGADGCFYRRGNDYATIPGFPAQAVDTTGAGDAFTGAFLARLLADDHAQALDALPAAVIEDTISFANAAGAVCISRYGAVPALPTLEEIRALKSHR